MLKCHYFIVNGSIRVSSFVIKYLCGTVMRLCVYAVMRPCGYAVVVMVVFAWLEGAEVCL